MSKIKLKKSILNEGHYINYFKISIMWKDLGILNVLARLK